MNIRGLKKFSNYLPDPLVWSDKGPVAGFPRLRNTVGPERRVQSNTSEVDCCQPEHSSLSKLHDARVAAEEIQTENIFRHCDYYSLKTLTMPTLTSF